MQIQVRNGSLTDGSETLLVNASNTEARLGSGVSNAIRMACGEGYQASIVKQMNDAFGGTMSPGDVFITDAGTHPRASFVAHVAVMDYRDLGENAFPDEERIQKGCERLWRVIATLQRPVTVAMVALGGGTGQLGVSMPTRIACETLQQHRIDNGAKNISGVTFYGWTLPEYRAMAETVRTFWPNADLDPSVEAAKSR